MTGAADFGGVDLALAVVVLALAALLLRRAVREAAFWQATVTPLASIIGSGFLIAAPLLAGVAGAHAVLAVLGIVLLSLWIGSALRFTIRCENAAGGTLDKSLSQRLERVSDLALAFAYLVSIAFYIRLMSGFVLTGLHHYTLFNANVVATGVLTFIGLYGLRRGLHGLERLETYSVTMKLAIIGALLLGLVFHDLRTGFSLDGIHEWAAGPWERVRLLGGMLLIVQGFETSKYLGEAYPAELRIRSMRVAQLLAGGIYVVFVALILPLLARQSVGPDETAIIELARGVTPLLPLMLIVAAVMSQLSAAVADTIGAGGVVAVETRRRWPTRVFYPGIMLMSIGLIWTADIFEIVALASRAFALYYGLQSILAARLAVDNCTGAHRARCVASYLLLAAIMLLVALFALPAHG